MGPVIGKNTNDTDAEPTEHAEKAPAIGVPKDTVFWEKVKAGIDVTQ